MTRLPKLISASVAPVMAVVAYFALVLYFAGHFAHPRPPGQIVVRLYPPFEPLGGNVFRAWNLLPQDMQTVLDLADGPHVQDGTSEIIVLEDDRQIGPAHSNFDEIRRIGNGRFTNGKPIWITFSASDNSDPNCNGHRYWAIVPFTPPKTAGTLCAPQSLSRCASPSKRPAAAIRGT